MPMGDQVRSPIMMNQGRWRLKPKWLPLYSEGRAIGTYVVGMDGAHRLQPITNLPMHKREEKNRMTQNRNGCLATT